MYSTISALLSPIIREASFLLLATERAYLKTASLQICLQYLNIGKLKSLPFKDFVDTKSFKVINSSNLINCNLFRKSLSIFFSINNLFFKL